MRAVLLDTHTIIWMVSDEERLGNHARDVMLDSSIQKMISPANYWEMAIKIKLGKLGLAAEYDDFIRDSVDIYALKILHIEPRHTSVLTTLELIHGDPFDRLLIAQATVEDIPIISVDRKFDDYPVARIWDYIIEEGDLEMEDDDGNGGEE